MARKSLRWLTAIVIVWSTVAPYSTGLAGGTEMAAEGLTTVKSAHGASETMERLKDAVRSRGMTIFAEIDHTAGAKEVGMSLRPTDLLIFGSPKGGTPLMQSVQTVGIELPLKALVWQDEAGVTWVSYNAPAWSAERHHANAPEAVRAMSAGIEAVVSAAASESPAR
ncbi:DUF302 domain-containing protein [Bradyrhizobium embrapense]